MTEDQNVCVPDVTITLASAGHLSSLLSGILSLGILVVGNMREEDREESSPFSKN